MNKNILILALVGTGLYLLYKNQNQNQGPPVTLPGPESPAKPANGMPFSTGNGTQVSGINLSTVHTVL